MESSKTLICGYGNIDRQDDGVAWHVLQALASLLGTGIPTFPEEGIYPLDDGVDYSFSLQLFPEMAENLAPYERVCFVDAHTGRVPGEIHREDLLPQFQASPFTHHLTPGSLLSIAAELYGHAPRGVLFSVRGYEFGFERSLSARTASLAGEAARRIVAWLSETG